MQADRRNIPRGRIDEGKGKHSTSSLNPHGNLHPAHAFESLRHIYIPATYKENAREGEYARTFFERLARIPFVVKGICIATVCSIVISTCIVTQCFGLFQGAEMGNYVGYATQAAEEELAHMKYTVRIEEQTTSSEDQIDKVIATDPSAGARIGADGVVVLKVGKAPEELKSVPQLVGKTEQEALDTLASTSFFVKGELKYKLAETQADKELLGRRNDVVIAQDPPADTQKTKGSVINLTILRAHA